MKSSRRHVAIILAALGVAGCSHASATDAAAAVAPRPYVVSIGSVRAQLSALADDSMEGRGTGTRGSARAAKYIAGQLAAAGLEPAGDSGFLQRVPLRLAARTRRESRFCREAPIVAAMPAGSWSAFDSLPPDRRTVGVNVVGILPGADSALRNEVVLIDAHYDHLGMCAALSPASDSIFNGADDDASGTVAVMQIARALASGPRPRRTIVFLTSTGEESGLIGTHWFIDHPPRPLDALVANLEIEMVARPDSLAGGPGRAWLTGWERTTMGDMLAAAGIPIEPDRRLDQSFFQRSDNIALAERGVVAQTLSTFNLHREYHTPLDDLSRVDFEHMTAVVDAAARAARVLADGARPEWKPGGRPTPRRR